MRLPPLARRILEHSVPGQARWRYVFGSGLLFAMVLQVITGVAMAFVYVPSAREAYGSVTFIQHELTLGWLIRGLHHFGASAAIVLAALHLGQVFLAGAYRPPRQASWLSGLAMLGLLLGLGLTGYLLPWDQKGYWATRVATSILGDLPLVGEPLQRVLQGGSGYGTATIGRFYALHAFILPAGLAALLLPHLLLFFRQGVAAPERDRRSGRTEPFWPRQAFMDLLFMTFVATVLVVLAATLGAPLDAPADPASTYDARPEWYFLFLFQLLKSFEGPAVLLGSVVLPGLATAFLVLLPWIDPDPTRRPWARPLVLCLMGLGLAAVLGLTAQALSRDSTDPGYLARRASQNAEARFAQRHAAEGFTPGGLIPALEGRRLFDRLGCSGCHEAEGRGARKAPRLDRYASRAWFRAQLVGPDAPERFGATDLAGQMPPATVEYDEEQVADLVEALASRAGLSYRPPVDPDRAKRGEEILAEGTCAGCHSLDGGPVVGPSLQAYGSNTFLKALLRDPGQDNLYGALNKMPAFPDLGPEQVRALLAYLRALRAPDPERRRR